MRTFLEKMAIAAAIKVRSLKLNWICGNLFSKQTHQLPLQVEYCNQNGLNMVHFITKMGHFISEKWYTLFPKFAKMIDMYVLQSQTIIKIGFVGLKFNNCL